MSGNSSTGTLPGDDATAMTSETVASKSTRGTPQPVAGEHWGERGHDALMRIPVEVKIVIGSTRMTIAKLMSLTRGAVIPLDRQVGDLVDIVVNDRLVARGEVIAMDESGERFGIAVRDVAMVKDG